MRRFFYRTERCTQGLPLSTPQPINKLNGGKVFSKIDLSEAYLQIPVEENSSKLLCINTHRGLYKFDRLVFGIKVAPAIFQQVMDTMLGGFDFTFVYLDDIVICSKTKELHREHLNKVFGQIREFGFKVKEAKCDFYMNKIKYLGHIIDKDGRRPDLERATTINDMPALDNVTTLQSFLGLANYYQSFIKNLHHLRTPLNELLKKKIKSGDGRPNVKQISHADGLSRLVLKYSEPFEDTIIAALRTDCEIKSMIANTIKELPVTLLEIKSVAMNNEFITNIKQKKKRKSNRSIFTM